MALKATSKVAPEWYTPESQKEEEEPTRFKIRPLTDPELEEVFEMAEQGLIVPMKNYGKVLALGVTDWENFLDPETGRPMKFSQHNKARIPFAERVELVGVIMERSQLTEDDRKNS